MAVINPIILLQAFLFFVCLIPFCLVLLKRARGGNLSRRLPPSPPKLPIIGNLHQIGPLPHRSLQSLSKKYGPMMLLHLGSVPTLVVSSPEIVKEMLKTHDIIFSNRVKPMSVHVILNGCNDLAFSPYGEYWRKLRKLCVQELLSIRRVQSFQFLREEEVDRLVKRIRRHSGRETVDVSELLLEATNDIACRSVIGQRCEGENGKSGWGDLSKKLLLTFPSFGFGDFFPSLGWMDELTGMTRRPRRTFEEVDAFFEEVIEERRASLTDGSLSSKRTLVDILLHLKENDSQDFDLDKATMKAILLDMFVGSTDTSLTTMEWAMTELMKKPNIMKKVQKEVREVVGKKSKVDENDINQMGYLKCVIKETLRLHAPVPLLLPRETSATATLGGYDIPCKARVYVNVWAIQRDPEVWDKAEEFIPERFENNNSVDSIDPDFRYFPFGGGRRICAGMSFAQATIDYVMANLLYWFDWELPAGVTADDLDMSELFGLNILKKVPLRLLPISYHTT
ncbi:hypothetical protein SLA2020_450670 [Shorea laevis]